jgi:hypothetical protein
LNRIGLEKLLKESYPCAGIPSVAKATVAKGAVMARLKPRPFKTGVIVVRGEESRA